MHTLIVVMLFVTMYNVNADKTKHIECGIS